MFLVTLLWSSSFPVHKWLMNGGMPPLSLAAYRYFSASIILVIVLGLRDRGKVQAEPTAQRFGLTHWLIIVGIGVFTYAAQGVHLTALSMITASDSGLVSMTAMPVWVAILASVIERTPPTRVQLCGLGIVLFGIYIYFPHDIQGARLAGLLLNVLSSAMWAVGVILTHIAVSKMRITSLKLTTVSMLTGSSVLLFAALLHNGLYVPGIGEALSLAFLASVNTAFAFALYNHTMKTLGAFEIVVFQDSMVIQIGLLSAIFLAEAITFIMAIGMLLVVFGVGVVQHYAPER